MGPDQNQTNPEQPNSQPIVQPQSQVFQPQVIQPQTQTNTPDLASPQPVSPPVYTQSSQPAPVVGNVAQNTAPTTSYGAGQQKPRRSKKFIILIAIFVLVGLGSLFAFKFARNYKAVIYHSNTTGSQQYTDPLGFKITPPKGWVKITSPPTGTLVEFQSTNRDAANNSFHDTIGVEGTALKSKSAQSITLDTFVGSSIDALKKSIPSFVPEQTAPETLNGTPATLVTASYTDAAGNKLSTESLFVIKNDVAYTVDGFGLAENWPQNGTTIQNSLLSFAP